MERLIFLLALLLAVSPLQAAAPTSGLASWYGEEHRGKLMANGKPFNPDRLTCASWHYPFGTRLRVRTASKSVVVTVTDRGPNRRFRERVVDLSAAAFRRLADPDIGLVRVRVERI